MPQTQKKQPILPPQHQMRQPGIESQMHPRPEYDNPRYIGSYKLKGKVALITGADSGIGRAVSVAFAKEGAAICGVYLDEESDMAETKSAVEAYGVACESWKGDIGDPACCNRAVHFTMEKFGGIDILVNNAAEQHPEDTLEHITDEHLEKTFRTNIFSLFYLTRACLPHLKSGSAIINTTSVTAYRGSPALLDYSSTKGAIVSFTRSLSASLIEKGIRVNAVAPGPVWTPLIPATFSSEKVSTFGSDVPLRRPGQPYEIAPSFVFLASEDSSYMTGQVLHPNGGEIING